MSNNINSNRSRRGYDSALNSGSADTDRKYHSKCGYCNRHSCRGNPCQQQEQDQKEEERRKQEELERKLQEERERQEREERQRQEQEKQAKEERERQEQIKIINDAEASLKSAHNATTSVKGKMEGYAAGLPRAF